MWGNWTQWSNCTGPCGSETRTRTRICDSPTAAGLGLNCIGVQNETQDCLLSDMCSGK